MSDIIYESRCKICKHHLRSEIEQRRLNGDTLTSIAYWLETEHKYTVTTSAIKRHFEKHFPVASIAAKKYAATVAFHDAVDKKVTEIQMMDEVMEKAIEMYRTTYDRIKELMTLKEKVPQTFVQLLAMCASEIRQHAKTKADLLGDNKSDKEISLEDILANAWTNKLEDGKTMDADVVDVTDQVLLSNEKDSDDESPLN